MKETTYREEIDSHEEVASSNNVVTATTAGFQDTQDGPLFISGTSAFVSHPLNEKNQAQIYALLDNCSIDSYVTEKLVQQLDLELSEPKEIAPDRLASAESLNCRMIRFALHQRDGDRVLVTAYVLPSIIGRVNALHRRGEQMVTKSQEVDALLASGNYHEMLSVPMTRIHGNFFENRIEVGPFDGSAF